MKYFLFNHEGSKNHGCEAIVRGSMNIIENSDEKAEFVLSSNNPSDDIIINNITVKAAKTRDLTKVEKLIAAVDLKINNSETYALQKMYSPIVSDAEDCDVCLSVGGDTYCYGDNHGIQVLTRELKKRGKKTVLWGASIGAEDLSERKLESLRDFDAIFTREPITYELLKENGANDNIYLFSDPAFCMERVEVEPIDGFTRENTLGFNISPLVASGDPRKKEIAEDFLRFVFENTTMKVLLVPHVVEENNNDYDFMKPIFEKFEHTGRIAILPPDLEARQYKGYIAGTRFFVGARTHSTIAAYSSGVPTIALGYSVKARGIAKDIFGEEKYVLDIKAMTDYEELRDEFLKLLENENEIRRELMKSIPLRMRSAMEAGEMLQKI
ncbi:MAG: polysaccharide pyruvyl transferase family protein [Clostridiaceae bacterium]|nr:polysaccharide pyruvyl transferase family protein [Clostridiaceae bacterium]MDY5890191.1 polysaccharide pyruvyl transferase family protein [Oscillospiraceae bacterium]